MMSCGEMSRPGLHGGHILPCGLHASSIANLVCTAERKPTWVPCCAQEFDAEDEDDADDDEEEEEEEDEEKPAKKKPAPKKPAAKAAAPKGNGKANGGKKGTEGKKAGGKAGGAKSGLSCGPKSSLMHCLLHLGVTADTQLPAQF